jgi:hypothetical protein
LHVVEIFLEKLIVSEWDILNSKVHYHVKTLS